MDKRTMMKIQRLLKESWEATRTLSTTADIERDRVNRLLACIEESQSALANCLPPVDEF